MRAYFYFISDRYPRPFDVGDYNNLYLSNMKKSFLIICTLFIAISSFGQPDNNCIKDPSITVTGTATFELVPDKIFLDINLSEYERNDKKQLDEIESLFISVIDKLNIPRENLSLTDANSNFIRIPWKGEKIEKSKQYQLLVNDVQTLSSLLIELENVDISNVSVSYVDHSKIEEFKKQVKINAIIAAKEKAEYLLNAIGQKLGDPIEIFESNFDYVPKLSNSVAGMNIRGAREDGTIYYIDGQITFEKIKLNYSITAKFKIIN